jgi:predicted Zn-dependent protease
VLAKLIGRAVLAGLVVLGSISASGAEPEPGVKVGNPSFVRRLVPVEKVEQIGEQQYLQLSKQAVQKGALLPEQHPHVRRVRTVFNALLPHAAKFNERAKGWRWEVSVLKTPAINAFCLPGGKVAVFTGIIDRLQLTDDELAMVMGHEIAHALREHARERLAKTTLTNLGAMAVSVLVGGNAGELARISGGLLNLRFSRGDETEADLIGMELAARAGYDPRAGITLWEKMTQASKAGPPQWLSTHPSGQSRIDTIKANLKDVLPLYERAKASKAG